MAGRSVLISFITKFSNKGLKNATKDLSGMEKLTKRFSLGTKAAFAAAATAATVFAERLVRKSIKAIVEEQKQVATLTKTFENLGKGIELPQVLKFADDLQRASGISESILRPALGALTQTLGETTAAQELLKKAIDISAGSGASLESVVSALQKAFNGNLKPLGQLIPSLDRAAIKSGDLTAVMNQLTTLFGGQGAVAAATMQGSLDRLKISADEAAERLGKGIGDALKILGTDGQSQVNNLGKSLEIAADRTSILLAGLASVGKELSEKLKRGYNDLNKQTDGLIGRVVKWGFETSIVGRAYNYLTKKGNEALETEAKIAAEKAAQTQSTFQYSAALIEQANVIKGNLLLEEAARKAAEKAAAAEKKRKAEEAKRKAEKAKQDRDDKTRAALAAKFDLDLIQLEAAKKNAKTAEEKARLEALMAIKSEAVKDDEASLQKLIALDEARNKSLMAQAGEIAKLAAEDAKRVLGIAGAIDELNKKKIEIPVTYVTKSGVEVPGASTGESLAERRARKAPVVLLNQIAPQVESPIATMPPAPTRYDTAMVDAANYSAALGAYFGGVGAQPVVNVNVQGSVVSEMDLRATIETLFFQSQRAGTQTTLPNLGR